MSEETKPTEPTPTIDQLFANFCKEVGYAPIAVAIAPVTNTPVPVIDLMIVKWNLEIRLVKTQG